VNLAGQLIAVAIEHGFPHWRAQGTIFRGWELRRMYVDPGARRHGIARQMLRFAEDECRHRKIFRLELSTSELQDAAIALYGSAGYRLVRQDLAQIGSNKTVGAGLRRFYFEKPL
jgi:GNAT superfamily N-acetyltransferase